MGKEDVGYICNGILLDYKNEILLFPTTWVDLEGMLLSEINQADKDKGCLIPFICEILNK